VVEQQHPSPAAGDPLAEAPTRPPVEEGVGARQPVGDRPELVGVAQVERLGTLPGLGLAQVYIPPNMPPVMFSTWPCT
jgi:hypothetical protein